MTEIVLSVILVVMGAVFVVFNRSMARRAQKEKSKFIGGDPYDKLEIAARRIEALIVGVASLVTGLFVLLNLLLDKSQVRFWLSLLCASPF